MDHSVAKYDYFYYIHIFNRLNQLRFYIITLLYIMYNSNRRDNILAKQEAQQSFLSWKEDIKTYFYQYH